MFAKAALTLATAVALLLALPALGPLIAGGSWWGPSAAVVAACAAAGLGLRAARLPAATVPVLQAAVALCVLTGAFVPHTAPLGFVPTPDALRDLAAVFTEGRAQIGTETTPVPATPALALVVATALGMLEIVADFLVVTARAAAMTALPLAGLLLVPLLVDDRGLAPVAFAGAAAGYVVLLAVDGWVRGADWGVPVRSAHDTAAPVLGGFQHVGTAGGVAAAAVALALVVPLAVPGLSSSSLYALADGSRLGGETVTTTHPLVSLRRDLSSTSDRPVLTYRTDADTPDYLRMYSLDAFDGQNWTMSRLRAEGDGDLDDEMLPSPPGRTTIDSERTTTEVTLADRFETDFLPMPYPPRELSASGEWYADADTLMVFTTGSPTRGGDYEVTSLDNEPDPEALAADAPPGSDLDERYLDVPGSVGERTADLAASITSGADTAYDQAVALQEWFTERDRFTYDLTPPSVPDGEDPLSYFLFDNRVGYCEQFAGAMALLARQAGIPARVAIGYTSGTATGDGTWEVTESDAHAWPELYFEDAGWLRFEPTPSSPGGQGTATVPDYADGAPSAPQDGSAPGRQEPQDDGGAGASAEPEAPGASAASESPAAEEDEGRGGLAGGVGDGRGPGWWAALVLTAVLACALLPALARFLLRRTRWVRAGSATQRARAAWRELRDDSRDLGLAWSAAESPRAVAQRLSEDPGLPEQARAALWRLAMGEETARYSPEFAQEGSPSDDGRRVRAALRAACGRAAALRAVVLPRSLLPAPQAPVPDPPRAASSGAAAG
ncbi:transglutaminaseTgpA domain-containing protein [Streptomonospora salina]|uniref:Transglutaminase-like putative cysteine protease n=1 Tax=Streptomonospora salina TaxID=104205 RepID=A0A841E625_9ACTN|nr:DUF3488 and transglutaminase-like domain-containing protein [Streptomonospora salina]MBB5996759.1 transglutaminase-like putative cysteine protease [Streptomonospora salina]